MFRFGQIVVARRPASHSPLWRRRVVRQPWSL